jgi:hypothetical protein
MGSDVTDYLFEDEDWVSRYLGRCQTDTIDIGFGTQPVVQFSTGGKTAFRCTPVGNLVDGLMTNQSLFPR